MGAAYGLCNAYCEAQDADIAFFSGDLLAKASHLRLLDNYNKKKNAGDPDMPCLRSTCPCFIADDLAEFGGASSICFYSVPGTGDALYAQFGGDTCGGIGKLTVEQSSRCFYRMDAPNE